MSLSTRLKASLIHLALSAIVAIGVAGIVFGLWYPGPYRVLSGGQGLLWLIVAVDVVLGPLLTFVVFDVRKPVRELTRDLAVIGLLQLAALAYGAWTLFVARPVYLVYEVDRFRVVAAADIDREELDKAPEEFKHLPLTGPVLIAARRATTGQEVLEGVDRATLGIEISMQPTRWARYDDAQRSLAVGRALAFDAAAARPLLQQAMAQTAAQRGRQPQGLALLPVQSRFATWSAVVDERGEPLQLVPVDSF